MQDLTGSKNTRGATLQNKTGSNRKTKEQEEAQKEKCYGDGDGPRLSPGIGADT